ncbi:hypothetical protein F443_05852 [Phytophthora nicotianae P1569]|uniref:Uncharacterized protein n=1 Tax=Phytophthora nicotianae P1569 TaxID=1317065 RepID=V9FI06_PHYNI|nr:hypothetical protein F443_05852 [Phytophthora nicotianae P1569]
MKNMPAIITRSITPNMTSHFIRRGSAAYANASPKLAIQGISTRGAWLLESLTKAFAYIGTTTREDESVAKVLAGYASTDLPVQTPTIEDLEQRLSLAQFDQLMTLRDELFRYVLGSPDAHLNVAIEVVNATFAALIMHLKSVLEAAANGVTSTRYLYELERGHPTERWRSVNHAQIGDVVSGGDTVLASTMDPEV